MKNSLNNQCPYTCSMIVIVERTVNLAGDGRFDSPGHCARYCTYTFIDTVSVMVNNFITNITVTVTKS